MSKNTKKTKTKSNELEKCRKKINELNEELKFEKNKSEEYLTKLKYLQAEFENYKKRIEKEIENKKLNYTTNLFRKLITPIDELEIALKEAEKENEISSLRKGLELVLSKFKKILVEEGVKEIEAVGKIFDPQLHEAVQIENRNDYPDNYILEELRKGYLLNDYLIRPSMVKISRKVEDNKGGA
ncbi:MAG: nucleotide exchange factor GrpE [Candidatus Odinarchaeia archaeon]